MPTGRPATASSCLRNYSGYGDGAAGGQQQCREVGVHETRKCVEFRIAALTILLLISRAAGHSRPDQFLAEYFSVRHLLVVRWFFYVVITIL